MAAPTPAAHAVNRCPICKARSKNRSRHGSGIGVTPPGNPRLPWEPIARRINAIVGEILPRIEHARWLEIDHRQEVRWRQNGIELHDADRIAAQLHCHPSELWGPAYEVGFHLCPIANADELEAA